MDPLAGQLGARLKAQRTVTDTEFDELLPIRPRIRSLSYWSSVEVCQTAARWLAAAGARRVLDVGSGVGKFAAIASLSTGREVWGIELRPDLALASRALAQQLGANVTLLEGTLDEVEASHFDGFYFFNPFAEHLSEPHERYDEHFPGSVDGFLHDVRVVEKWLRAAPEGTAMVTYNGLGGRIPLSWRVEKSTVLSGDNLRLWVKRGTDDSTDAIIEINEHLIPASKLASLVKGGDSRVKGSSLIARLVTGSDASLSGATRKPGSDASLSGATRKPGSDASLSGATRKPGSDASLSGATRKPGSDASLSGATRKPGSDASLSGATRKPGSDASLSGVTRKPGSDASLSGATRKPGTG